jgi:hypothetical protein
MQPELAPVRAAQRLLKDERSADEVLEELQESFGLDFVDAMASAAAASLLTSHGVAVAEESIGRPYVARAW